MAANRQRDCWFTDYFAFTRGRYYKKIPPFVIGRVAWDNWLTWYVLDSGVPVVDIVYGHTIPYPHLVYKWTYALFDLIVGRERSHYLAGNQD
jgi:hypothetical protein